MFLTGILLSARQSEPTDGRPPLVFINIEGLSFLAQLNALPPTGAPTPGTVVDAEVETQYRANKAPLYWVRRLSVS